MTTVPITVVGLCGECLILCRQHDLGSDNFCRNVLSQFDVGSDFMSVSMCRARFRSR